MHWETVYLTCFGIGLALSILACIGGLGHFHFGHFHFGHFAHHVHVPQGVGQPHAASGISPINGFTITAFLCWFGGTGYLLYHYRLFFGPLIVLVATAAGIAGAGMVFFFLVKVLLPHEHSMTPDETAVIGVVGRLSSGIRTGGTGEILYSQSGSRRAAPARSEDGVALAKDTEVIVLRYEKGIAFVRPWDAVANEFDTSLRPTSQMGES